MFHFFVPPEQVCADMIRIEGSDVNHIRNVLRMSLGTEITVSGGDTKYRCKITEIEEQFVCAEILWVEESGAELPSKICLLQGLPKGDKMELIIQKAVELGVHEIVPVACKRTVVRLDEKKEAAKLRRWRAVAESAAKQSKRGMIPDIRPVMSFDEAVRYAKEAYEVRLLPYELAEGMERTREVIGRIRPGQSVAVFIGPEGGFEESEVLLAEKADAVRITLGKRILRTETAGMTVLSILMYSLEGK